MKKWILGLTVLISLVSFTDQAFASAGELFKAKNMRGKVTKVKAGKKTVVQFWASWCVTCGETMQKLNRMTRKNKRTQFYGISLDESRGMMKNYVKAKPFMNKFRRKLLWDPQTKLAERYNVEAIPTIIVFDKNGDEIFRTEGSPSSSQLKELRKAVRG